MGHVDGIEALVSAGAALEAIDTKQRTLLHLAAEHGRAAAVKALVAAGAALTARDEDGRDPLTTATHAGHGAARKALRATHQPDETVSHRTSASPASKPWQGRGWPGTEGGGGQRKHARRTSRPLCSSRIPPCMIPLRRPSRRSLQNNDLGGSLPSQLGLLTALTIL